MALQDPLPSVPWWIKAIVATLLGVLGTMYTANRSVTLSDKASIISRVSSLEAGQQKLEAHQSDDHEILSHIQAQVDKLMVWALGKKD